MVDGNKLFVENVLRETSTYKFIRKTNNNNILKDGRFDFFKVPNLRVFAGALLHRYRNRNKLTQKRLAELIGSTRRSVQNWEMNISSIPLNMLLKVAELGNISKDELLQELQKEEIKFSLKSPAIMLPFSLNEFHNGELKDVYPHKGDRIYLISRKKDRNIKALSIFLNTFFSFEKRNKFQVPLTNIVETWKTNEIDLMVPISVLFITEGALSKGDEKHNPSLLFINNSKYLHDILIDSIFYKFAMLPSSYILERKRAPKNSTYITQYSRITHFTIINELNKEIENIKTCPHENETIEEFLKSPQTNLDFILNKSKTEKMIALALFIATEGSVYISNRFGFVYPVIEIGCTNPRIIDFLERLSGELSLNFKRLKSKKTWSGFKGVRARGLAAALKLLILDCFITDVKITSKSTYYEGFDKKELLLSILEFRVRQEDRELFGIPVKEANLEILKILKNKEFKSPEFYIRLFGKNKKVRRWL